MTRTNSRTDFGMIKFIIGPQMDNVIKIAKLMTTIGRDPDNDIVVTDPTVSPHHARIVCEEESWRIETISPDDTITVNKCDLPQSTIHDCAIVGIGRDTAFIFLLSSASQRLLNPATGNTQSLDSHASPTTSALIPDEAGDLQDSASTSPLVYEQFEAFTQPDLPEQGSPTHSLSLDQSSSPQSMTGVHQPLPRKGGETQLLPILEMGIPFLEVSSNTLQERKIYPLVKGVMNIGRDPSNDIVLSESHISMQMRQTIC